MHVLALASCWLNALPLLLQLLLSGWVLINGYQHRKPQAAIDTRLRYSPQSAWTVCYPGADDVSIEILPSTVVSAVACCIHYADPNGKRYLLVMRDALSADAFRRLKVQLKITANSPQAARASG